MLFCVFQSVHANETEIVAMPTGRLLDDGTWRSTFTYGKPYSTISSEVAVLPWLQGGFGFVRMMGVQGFANSSSQYSAFTQNYGDNKDKTVFGKIKLSDESEFMPAMALVLQDPIGTSLFKYSAIAVSKKIQLSGVGVDATVGYGTGRVSGFFGGVTANVPGVRGLRVSIEKDAIDYRKDLFAAQTGLNNVRQPVAYGLEYKDDTSNYAVKLAKRMGTTELKLSVYTDNNVRDVIAKTKSYPRFRTQVVQPTEQQWFNQPAHKRVMLELLQSYGFERVTIEYSANKTLQLTMTHPKHLHVSAAVGDAVHIALKLGPREMREMSVVYLNYETNIKLAHYSFTDPAALKNYIAGAVSQSDLLPTVRVKSTDDVPVEIGITRSQTSDPNDTAEVLTHVKDAGKSEPEFIVNSPALMKPIDLTMAGAFNQLGVQPRQANAQWAFNAPNVSWDSGGDRNHRVTIGPKVALYLNGPGVVQYAAKLGLQYDGKMGDKTFSSVNINQTIFENISKLGIAPSTSTLEPVRSRTAYYEQGKQLKIDTAVINRFEQLDSNTYGRFNVGLFERSFAGAGAQILWAPSKAAWSADLSVDAVAQRAETNVFGFGNYKTVTAIGSLHYRLPMDVSITARAGRFLAKDVGVRMEFLRRFWGGIEVGAWASVTNAKDFGVNPGSNYRDKGLMLNIPMDSFSQVLTRQKITTSLAPWTRDIAQMVRNPADLYELLQEDLRSKRVQNGLERFSGVSDYDGVVTMGALAMDDGVVKPIGNAARTLNRELVKADLTAMVTAGALFTATAALSDRSVNKWMTRATSSGVQQNRFKQLNSANTALTVLGLGTAALWAYDGSDWQRSNAALASLEASGAAVIMATGIKYLTGRARPSDGLGASNFGNVPRGSSAFLSRHVALSTALVTPLALHYDAPILYALPALTALSRLGTRQHWASDVAAGGAIGYALGHLFYKGHTSESSQRKQPMFNMTRDSIKVTIPTE